MPIANAFLTQEQLDKEYFFNLTSMICPNCLLFQLKDQPPANLLFHDNYAFFAETSEYMQIHFNNLAKELIDRFELKQSDIVAEIGSNDGGVIHYLNQLGFNNVLGIEPSKNVCDRSISKGLTMENSFFDYALTKKIKNRYPNFKFFLALNTLAHIDNIYDVFQGVENILDPNGVFITEDPYLFTVFDKVSYDQVYDEHVFIFSLTAMNNICNNFSLNLFDVKPLNTAGGSMRYYISKNKNIKKSDNFNKYLQFETNSHDDGRLSIYKKFYDDCMKSKNSLNNFLDTHSNKTIASYGATSKSTTIFNFCDIDSSQINYITDTTSTKINKLSPGKHIPIYDHKYFLDNMPDLCFLGAWNHKDEIFLKEKDFFSKKGKWFTHIPNTDFINDLY